MAEKIYILGYDKTAVDKKAVKLTFRNVYEGTLVPTFMVCNDLKMHGQLNGFECYYKGTDRYCTTLCGNCIEVLRMILKKARKR